MRGRAVSAAAISAFALMAGGCHRHATQASQPPPPPATRTAANHNSRSARPAHPNSGGTAAGTVVPSPPPATVPAPPPSPNGLGKPVSTEVGLASWYGPPYAGRKGADGT